MSTRRSVLPFGFRGPGSAPGQAIPPSLGARIRVLPVTRVVVRHDPLDAQHHEGDQNEEDVSHCFLPQGGLSEPIRSGR